ncbi:flagellar hook-length control protein FliK [Bremerella cremea]|nr:flagellar hook-length control protein FliK [Bremerella cremea]
MKSSSSQSVNPVPNWGNNNRSQSNRSADPLAFFDLIMDSARSSLGQGQNSLDPTTAMTPTSTPQTGDSQAAADKPGRQDDHRDHDESTNSSAYSGSSPREVTEPSDARNEEVESEDVSDVVDLTDDQAVEDAPPEEADQAALETAAAAGQSQQLLGPPDTLAPEPEQEAESAEEVAASNAKSVLPNETKATPPVDTDKPLDTSMEAESGEGQLAATEASEVDEKVVKDSAKDEELGSEENEEVSLETEPVETRAEVHDEPVERDAEATQDESEASELEVNAEEEGVTVEQDSRDESSRNGKDSSRSQQTAKADAKVETAAATQEASSPVTVQMPAATEAAEAVAANNAAASASAAQSSAPTTTSSTSGTNPNNLAGLLQRGLQRGTLQKSAESKSTPQLDPKQQIRLINRVARAVETTPAGQSIKIRLNPSELGQLKVEIKIEQGNMIAKIEAENPATRQVLLQHLPQLRERLAESNINVQQFDVDVMGQQDTTDGGASNLGDQQAGNESSSGGSRQWGTTSRGDDEVAAPRAEQVNKEAERDSRNLNITI